MWSSRVRISTVSCFCDPDGSILITKFLPESEYVRHFPVVQLSHDRLIRGTACCTYGLSHFQGVTDYGVSAFQGNPICIVEPRRFID